MPKRRTTSTSRRAGYSRKGRVASSPKRRRITRVSNRNDDGGAAFAAAFGSVQPPEKSHRDPRVDELLRQQEAATAARLQALDESDADDGSDDDAEDGDNNDEDYMDEGEEEDDDDDARIVRERRNDLSDIASARALIDQLAQKPELDARRSRILEVRRAAQGHADSDTESEDDLIMCSSDDEVADDEDDGIAEYDSDEDDIPLAMLANTTTASRRKGTSQAPQSPQGCAGTHSQPSRQAVCPWRRTQALGKSCFPPADERGGGSLQGSQSIRQRDHALDELDAHPPATAFHGTRLGGTRQGGCDNRGRRSKGVPQTSQDRVHEVDQRGRRTGASGNRQHHRKGCDDLHCHSSEPKEWRPTWWGGLFPEEIID